MIKYPMLKLATMGVSLALGFALGAATLGAMLTASADEGQPRKVLRYVNVMSLMMKTQSGEQLFFCVPEQDTASVVPE